MPQLTLERISPKAFDRLKELAARQGRTEAEIASEIQRGLDFLAADARDVPERHRSMAAGATRSPREATPPQAPIGPPKAAASRIRTCS